MNPVDPDLSDERVEPSRSQRRRDALDVLHLAQELVNLSPAQLEQLPLDDELREEVLRSRGVRQQIARKRQIQFLAKQLRTLEADELEPLRAALAHDRDLARREAATMHHVENWRERLIDQGDEALSELLQEHPHADRQHLRQLVRNSRNERERQHPPHAQRELFRAVRELLDDNGN